MILWISPQQIYNLSAEILFAKWHKFEPHESNLTDSKTHHQHKNNIIEAKVGQSYLVDCHNYGKQFQTL